MRGQFNLSPMSILLMLVVMIVSLLIIYGIYIYMTEGSIVAADNILFGSLNELGLVSE
ncbi:hypothetical protein HOD83_00410 [Candidatus Woesearchaeota archaeon]|nr:hypothetical protein [Candidatus Woesearchaeota archaeon]MBT4248039.1 hypothetical protein [Candidatus Woesearchaeota archaeon]